MQGGSQEVAEGAALSTPLKVVAGYTLSLAKARAKASVRLLLQHPYSNPGYSTDAHVQR